MNQIKILKHHFDTILFPTAPFHFDGTVYKPSHFPSTDVAYEEGKYWRTMRFEDSVFGMKMVNQGTVEEPEVSVSVYSEKEAHPGQYQRICREIEYRFDLKADLAAFVDDCGGDDLLKPALQRWRGMRVSAGESLYEFLVLATVLQNATVRRSVQMLENLFNRFGSVVSFDRKELSAYWPPEAIVQAGEQELRDLKVGYRAKTLIRQAQEFVNEGMDEYSLRVFPSDRLKAELLDLYGIGPASVWYLLFGVFKRYDALEYVSPWEQKIYSRLLFDQEMVDAEVILGEVERRWGKWKMLAVHYIFEDLFWQRKTAPVPWLEELIRL